MNTCDKVDGVGVPVNSEQVQLTDFRNEACDQVTVCGFAYRGHAGVVREPTLLDVKKYLARPIRYATSSYSSVTRQLVASFPIDAGDYRLADIALGAFGFRATLCFRLQFAATPFQAGVIRMVWQPQIAAASDPNCRFLTANQVSMLPGVNLDICEQTSVVLRVPFVNSYNYYPIIGNSVTGLTYDFYGVTPPESLGILALFSYLPLSIAAGATNPSYALYTWLEDVELLGASNSTYTTVVPQAGAENAKVGGPLETMLSAASKVVSTYGGYVPMLSSYAGPTSWMLRMAAKVASSFGWSKPLDVMHAVRMQQTQNVYQQNCDGFDVVYNAGLLSDNCVAVDVGFAGVDIDEMAFDYLLSVPALISNGVLTTSDTVDGVKYACAVAPKSMWYNGAAPLNVPNIPTTNSVGGVLTNGAILTTPLFFLSNVATYWQGDIKFTIRFAKTKFHTGRYLLAFNPAWGALAVSQTSMKGPTGYAQNNFKGTVLDLREGNVFEFIIPFTSPVSYNFVGQTIGVFTMTVVDPLVCPSTVSSTVPFAVEVSAMPGFQFAGFHSPDLCLAPFTGTTLYSQVGIEALTSQVSSRDAGTCIGERITSVKQLIAKACPDTFSGGLGVKTVSPFWIYNYPNWASNNVLGLQGGNAGSTSVTHLGRTLTTMYAYARGSTSVDVMKTTSGAGPIVAWFRSGRFAASGLTDYNTSSDMIISEANALHIQVPFFAPTSRVLLKSINGYPNLTNGPGPAGSLCINQPASVSDCIFTRASDDAQLGYFLGTMPVTLDIANPTAQDASLFLNNFLSAPP